MEKLTIADQEKMTRQEPVDRSMQDRVLNSVEKWLIDVLYSECKGTDRMKCERDEYEVDSLLDFIVTGESPLAPTRKNAMLMVKFKEQNYSILTVIYLEFYRCFLVYTAKTLSAVCIEAGIKPEELAAGGFPDTSLFPRECFAYTANNIVDSINAQIVAAFHEYKSKYEGMSKDEKEETIDGLLDERDFDRLKWMDTVKGEIRVDKPAVLFLDDEHNFN
jgi:hypothetical protein